MLINTAAGAPVVWTIGARGERPDEWPARLVTAPAYGQDDRGNNGLVATIITHQTNLQGEHFYGERTVQVRYLFDRAERVEALDGTEDKPIPVRELIAMRQASVKGYLNSRGAGQNIGSLMAQATANIAGTAPQPAAPAAPVEPSVPATTDAPPQKPAK